MDFIFIESRRVFDVIDTAVNTQPHKTFTLNAHYNIFMLTLLASNKRGAYLYLRPFRSQQDRVNYLG